MKKVIIRFLAPIAIVYLALMAGLYISQETLIYHAAKNPFPVSESLVPGTREIQVTTEDGLKLTGWYSPAKKPSNITIVRFHGNGSNVKWNMNALLPYAQQGYGVLSAEYRGFSGNPGKPSEEGLYKDAHAYISWLKENGIPESNIIVYGESIGSGPAVQMAVDYPKIHALILQCPLSSLVDAASTHYWYAPVNQLLRDRYDNLSKIGQIKAPLILAHGTKDSVIPYALGKKLFDAAPNPKTLITIEGGNHNDLADFGMDQKILNALSE